MNARATFGAKRVAGLVLLAVSCGLIYVLYAFHGTLRVGMHVVAGVCLGLGLTWLLQDAYRAGQRSMQR